MRPKLQIGQRFMMSDRISPIPRLFEYEGSDPTGNSMFEHKVREVETGELSEVEDMWFQVRKIQLVESEVTA